MIKGLAYYLRIIAWLLGGVTIGATLILISETDTFYWLFLLLLNPLWFFIYLGGEQLAELEELTKEKV